MLDLFIGLKDNIIQMMYNNLNINFINFFSINDLQNNSWVFTILWMSIIFSLFLSFMFTKSPIISVLSLLLLSISAVFLWLFETQFLFIYLVYILAFIGAVLMLFLSVVLMLPISTIRNYNKKYMNKQVLILSFINLDDFYYKILGLGYNLKAFLFSGTFLLFILISLSIVVLINSWNYFKILRKFEVSCVTKGNLFSDTNTIVWADLLFFLVELFVAIKQNFFITSHYQAYNRLYPILSNSKFNDKALNQKQSARYGLLLNNSLVSAFSLLGVVDLVSYLETSIKNFLPQNKYIDYCVNLYTYLNSIYDLFILRNIKLSENNIKNINISDLSWSHINDNVLGEIREKCFAVSSSYTEYFFSDAFLQRNRGILPNRFFFIFNLGFFVGNFEYYTSLISKQLIKIDLKLFFNFDKRFIAIFKLIFISLEILLRIFLSFYLFVFYIFFGSFSVKYILLNIYLYIYKFSDFKTILNNFYSSLEVIIQSLLFISVIACVLPSFLTVFIVDNFNVINIAMSHYTGLSGIKFLLYEYNSLPLILSTFVLLIALIGASTLTKK